MKKRIPLLILSLLGLVVPLIFATAFSAHAEVDNDTSSDITSEIINEDPYDPSDGHYKIEFEEEKENYNITRYYKGYDVGVIQENFRAPSGCVLTVEANWNYLQDVRFELQEHEYINGKDDFSMVGVVIYRNINGSKIYSDSAYAWNVGREDLENYIKDTTSSLKLYEINEKISDVDVFSTIEVTVSTIVAEYEWPVDITLVFEVEPYHVKKYVPGDILSLEAGYYSDGRTSIMAVLDENLFNDKYGFKTDGREPYPWDETQYFENYLIQYFDKDTNIILDTDDAYDITPGVEFNNVPTKPLTVFALLTFNANGIEYKFYSNEIVIKDIIEGILIDGYNNRDSVGANTKHTLKLNVDHSNENITSAWLYVSLKGTSYEPCNHVCEPEKYWEYRSLSTGQYTSVTEDFWEFDFQYKIAGEYQLLIQLKYKTDKEYYDNLFELPLVISEIQKEYTPVDKALTFNVQEERIDCIAGGGAIDVSANIASDVLNDGEVPTFVWNVSRLNVVELVAEKNRVKILPIGSGVVTVTVTCSALAFDGITKSIVINVIDDIYSVSSIAAVDEFHYSGKDLVVWLSVDKYNNIVNFAPEWRVVDKDGEDVPYINNGDMTITVLSPKQNDYKVTALYNGIEIDSKIIEVRTVNVDKFVRSNIVWIVLITLGFMIVVLFLKSVLEKKGSLVAKIDKTYKKFEKTDRNSSDIDKKLKGIKLSILTDIDYAKNLNMNALNEYEKTIRYLGKSLADIKELSREKNKLNSQEFSDLYNKLDKDLSKALAVAKEIEDAKNLAEENSLKANKNNIAEAEKTKTKE